MMDEETRRLLFTTKDGRWPSETDYATDALEFDDEDIDFERFPAIRALLTPGARNEELRVPLDAALVLAAWGDDAGFEYLKYVVSLPRSDRARAGYSSDLRLYDTTLEWVARAISTYRASAFDRTGWDVHGPVVRPVLVELLHRSETDSFEFPLYTLGDDGDYDEVGADIRKYFVHILAEPDLNRYKIEDAAKYFELHDPAFLRQAMATYGGTAPSDGAAPD